MKTVVITGGTRGLGFCLAKEFRGKNYHVAICGTAPDSVGRAVASLRKTRGKGRILGIVCDVSVREDMTAFRDSVFKEFGHIDVWINNAGVNQSFKYAWELSKEEVSCLIDVDLKGVINGCSVAMEAMIRQGYGAIYSVEGMGSNDAIMPRFALYGTAKRAVTYYMDALAKEIEENHLPIISGKLSPGIMITEFLTSAGNRKNVTVLDEKTKKVYNILGDYPWVIAKYLVKELEKNKKNGKRIMWLTGKKAAFRFLTSGWKRRDFFRN